MEAVGVADNPGAGFNPDNEIGDRCAALSALFSILFTYPDLTVGPTHCRPFGPLSGLETASPWSLEEAADNSPGRKTGVGSDQRIERRRCGTKPNYTEIGFTKINPFKINDKDLLRASLISDFRFNPWRGFTA
jgi:hypothetical protein